MPDHRVIGRRQGEVLTGGKDVSHAFFKSAVRIGRSQVSALNISSVAVLALLAACVEARGHTLCRSRKLAARCRSPWTAGSGPRRSGTFFFCCTERTALIPLGLGL